MIRLLLMLEKLGKIGVNDIEKLKRRIVRIVKRNGIASVNQPVPNLLNKKIDELWYGLLKSFKIL